MKLVALSDDGGDVHAEWAQGQQPSRDRLIFILSSLSRTVFIPDDTIIQTIRYCFKRGFAIYVNF